MIPIGPISGAASKIAEYFGLIQGVNTKITKLVHQSFLSAKDNLAYAMRTTGQNHIDYVRQAKAEFIRAIAVEEDENKVLSIAGLSLCQYLLGENSNARETILRIKTVELTRSESVKSFGKEIFSNCFSLLNFDSTAMASVATSSMRRQLSFVNTRQSIYNSIEKLIQ